MLEQLPATNGKLQIATCDREPSDHVNAVTANHGSHLTINPCPASQHSKPLKGPAGSGSKGGLRLGYTVCPLRHCGTIYSKFKNPNFQIFEFPNPEFSNFQISLIENFQNLNSEIPKFIYSKWYPSARALQLTTTFFAYGCIRNHGMNRMQINGPHLWESSLKPLTPCFNVTQYRDGWEGVSLSLVGF